MKMWPFIIILFFCTLQAIGQHEQAPRLFHFNRLEYGAHNQNWSAAQSSEGFLYFANTEGLLEYDGCSWKLHPLPEGQTVRTVVAGKEGIIFTGAYEEFGFWKRDALGNLDYQSLSDKLPHGSVDQQEIWHILDDGKGIFFQSFGALFYYDYQKITEVSIPGTIMFLQKVDGQIFAPVIGRGIFRLKSDGSWTFVPGSQVFANKTITGLVADNGGMLAATQEAGLFRYNGKTFSVWEHPVNNALGKYGVNKILRLSDGRLAVGAILNGLYIFQSDNHGFMHLNRANGLQNNTVLSLFEDRSGNLWAGLDQGIDMLALGDPLVYYSDNQGEFGTVYAARSFEGRLYLGTNQGLFSAPFQDGRLLGPFTLLPGTQGQVWELKVFDGQLLWGHNQGTFRLEGNHAVPLSPMTGGWSTIPLPKQPEILLQGTYTGIAIFRKNEKGQWVFSKKMDGLSCPIRFLQADPTGYLWAVNPYEGAYRLKISEDATQLLRIDTIGVRSGLPSEYNLSFLMTDGQLRIWSKDKYYRWDEKTRRCEEAPLPHLSGSGLSNGKWILLADGSRFQVVQDRVARIRNRKVAEWLPVNLVKNNETIEILSDDLYLLCLDNGFALLPLNNRKPGMIPPAPVIKSLSPTENIRTGAGKRRTVWTIRGGKIIFPAQSNTVEAQFAAPLFTQKPAFRYRLRPLMETWSEWTFENKQEFTKLPPGAYTLELQSDLSESTARAQFQISRHWYQSPWCYVLFALILAGLVSLLYRLHHYRLAVQRRKLSIEKERQLHSQMLQAQAEQLQMDVLGKSSQLANSTFNLIRKNETLLQIKEALLRVKSDMGERLPDKSLERMIRLLDDHLSDEQDWEIFETNFTQVHEIFLKKLKTDFPDLTPGDLRLAAYLKMNLSSKEIAPLLKISIRGIENKRYRLRKKLELDNDENLTSFLMQYG